MNDLYLALHGVAIKKHAPAAAVAVLLGRGARAEDVFWSSQAPSLQATLDARRQRPTARCSWASRRRLHASVFYAARAD